MDLRKHETIFDPRRVADFDIVIIGVGALGSALALNLAKLGVKNLYLVDDDKVENHNLPNQILYGPHDVEKYKVIAASEAIDRLTGYEPAAVRARISSRSNGDQVLNQFTGGGTRKRHLFVCVDSMAARKEIFERLVYLKPNVSYFAEGRMGAREGMYYGFDPRIISKSREYLNRWYPDDEVAIAERAPCGTILSIGATALGLASLMTWNYMTFVGGKPTFDEIAVTLDPLEVTVRGNLVRAEQAA